MLKIGYFQFAPVFGQVQKNIEHVTAALADVNADILVLPELAFTGYHFDSKAELRQLAEDPANSQSVKALTAICRARDFYLVTGFAERAGDKVYNSSLLIGPQGIEGVYRKLHLFKDEKDFFEPGNIPLQAIEVRGARIGMMICFDWVFPEVARSLALQGVDVLCHPSNLVLTYCQQTMLSRCLENGVFAVTCNRWGCDERPHGRLDFTGQSQVVGPKAELLHRAPSDKDELFMVTIEPAVARAKQMTEGNDLLMDRRPEFYSLFSSLDCF
jgi:predicted amidohydrolase